MNRYPWWKYAILAIALLVGLLYTLPNFFGEAPAVQVSSGKATLKLDSGLVQRHPSVKVLALAFLVLVGMALVGEAFDMHIPKGYIYVAMLFSVTVEVLNIRARARRTAARRPA